MENISREITAKGRVFEFGSGSTPEGDLNQETLANPAISNLLKLISDVNVEEENQKPGLNGL